MRSARSRPARSGARYGTQERVSPRGTPVDWKNMCAALLLHSNARLQHLTRTSHPQLGAVASINQSADGEQSMRRTYTFIVVNSVLYT